MAFRYVQFEPLRALRAARVLAADPDDLPQVFTIIDSLSADTLHRAHRKLERSEEGRKLLATEPDIVALLADRDGLAAMPEGSLGREYLAFVERENISADGIREAAVRGSQERPDRPKRLDFVHARLRDTHDLWHAVVGYQGDVLGELALLGFTFAQIANPAIALILAIGLVKMGTWASRETVVDGFRRGKRAKLLLAQPWEEMLPLPVSEIRRRLGLDAPPDYEPLRSSMLREQGFLAPRR
ncbi:MAG: Coq4 family protein [Polyangiaceae bacterium]